MLFPFALLPPQLPQVTQPPRLRTILPNGATVLVVRVPGAKRLWTRLFLSARGAEDTPANHGTRHLLEHLVAVGYDGRLDERLEREGAFLRAETGRDATEFACDGPPNRLSLLLGALGEMLRLRPLDAITLSREAEIMRQEAATLEPSTRLSATAWRAAYGAAGLSPFGDLTAIRGATPASVAALHRRLCAGPNLVIVVSGDVDLDETTRAASAVVRLAPRIEAPFAVRNAGEGGEDDQAGTYGEARSLPVPAYDDPRTVAALAAALAVGSLIDDAFVTYTPSVRPGLVTLGRAGEITGVGAEFAKADPAFLWPRGRLLVDRWLRRQTVDPGRDASLRGLLLAQSPDATPDRMREAIAGLTYAEFAKALAAFDGRGAVRVTGG